MVLAAIAASAGDVDARIKEAARGVERTFAGVGESRPFIWRSAPAL